MASQKNAASLLMSNAIPKPPVTYRDFVKNPLTALLFMSISALVYFVYDLKQNDAKQRERIEILEKEMSRTYEQLATLKEENAALKTQLMFLTGKMVPLNTK